VGYVSTKAPITLGRTYFFRVVFKVSDDLNPHQHLLFQCFHGNTKNGIFELRRRNDGWIEGEVKIHYPGSGNASAEARILFRLSAAGRAWIRDISLAETEPVKPRWVTVACTQGRTDLESCHAVLEAAGKAGVDLVLLPEYMRGGRIEEPVPGPSSQLMAEMAAKHRMYVAGGIVRKVPETDRVYNTALLYDRAGKLWKFQYIISQWTEPYMSQGNKSNAIIDVQLNHSTLTPQLTAPRTNVEVPDSMFELANLKKLGK